MVGRRRGQNAQHRRPGHLRRTGADPPRKAPMSDVLVFASHLAKYTGYNNFVNAEECVATFWSTNPRLAAELGRDVAPAPRSAVESCAQSDRRAAAKYLGCADSELAPTVAAITERAARAATNEESVDCLAQALPVAQLRSLAKKSMADADEARTAAERARESAAELARRADVGDAAAAQARSRVMHEVASSRMEVDRLDEAAACARARATEARASLRRVEVSASSGDAAALVSVKSMAARADSVESEARSTERKAALARDVAERARVQSEASLMHMQAEAVAARTAAHAALREREAVAAAASSARREADAHAADLASVETVARAAERDTAMQRGTEGEASILDGLARDLKERVGHRNDRAYSKVVGRTAGGRRLVLVGRVDGKTEGGRLVEVKERRNRLFHRVYNYEKVQLFAYMHLLEQQSAVLRERFDSETRDHALEFDPGFWNEVTRRLRDFVQTQVGE